MSDNKVVEKVPAARDQGIALQADGGIPDGCGACTMDLPTDPSGMRANETSDGVSDAEYPGGVRAVDVFCGIGGLTYGLRAAGINVAAGVDFDPSCRYAYEVNNPGAEFLEADVCDMSFSDLESHYAEGRGSCVGRLCPVSAILSPHSSNRSHR